MTGEAGKSVLRDWATDAFISHAASDAKFANYVSQSLQLKGLVTWIDGSNIAFGTLLREELQAAIRTSRALVLLWSEAASNSRWVLAEIFTAFHLDRFIIPCVLDETPLPQFLQNSAYLSRSRDEADIGEKLARSIAVSPHCANKVGPWLGSRSQLVQSLVDEIGPGQNMIAMAMTKDFNNAANANAAAAKAVESARKLAPYDPMILNLTGYQCKNDYMFAHWDEIQGGRAPKDPLLDLGERNFFEALCVDPSDANAVNGLGSILKLERDLDAAEFFVRRAIDLIKAKGGAYEAARIDLESILLYKRQAATSSSPPEIRG